MVHCLKLQTPMDEVQPRRAIDVHSRAQHTLREGFRNAQIRGAHCEVRERDLHVHGHRHNMRYDDEEEAVPGVRNGFIDREIAEPVPEKQLSRDLEIAMPPRWPFARSLAQEDVLPAQHVKIKTPEC